MTTPLDDTDRLLIDRLQDGLPVTRDPYRDLAQETGLTTGEIVDRIGQLRETGVLTRFGPMFNAERMGGAFCLCAMAVPAERFDEITAVVNTHAQVAHNYQREHAFNMWFVLATESADTINTVAAGIERETGIEVLLFPKEAEYFVGLKVPA